ncbi:hypothetical protein GCM10020229_52090 [Kitasatospora albolonga]
MSCCGSEEPAEDAAAVQTGLSLDAALTALGGSVPVSADPTPYLQRNWLAATEAALAEAKPWHSVALREDEAAFLPGFVFDADPLVDADPRTYLGWQPKSGDVACCSVTSCCTDTVGQIEELGTEPFFPALLLGSPLGYRSEAVSNVEDPLLLADLVDRIVPAAIESGVRTIIAPWLPDGPQSEVLALALQAYGGDLAFHGEDNHFQLQHDSYDAFIASLPARKRRRIKEDHDRAVAAGARIERLDGAALTPHIDRIAELTTFNRQKYGGGEDASHIRALLASMVEGGTDVRGYLAFQDDVLVASSVTIREGRRVFVKWAGFDYAQLGERSGLYFELVLDLPLRDAFTEGAHTVVGGPGVDAAKRLRGFRPVTIRSAVLAADPALRPQVSAWHLAYGEDRRKALGAEVDEATTVVGRLRSRLLGGNAGVAYEPITPLQPEGGCCG